MNNDELQGEIETTQYVHIDKWTMQNWRKKLRPNYKFPLEKRIMLKLAVNIDTNKSILITQWGGINLFFSCRSYANNDCRFMMNNLSMLRFYLDYQGWIIWGYLNLKAENDICFNYWRIRGGGGDILPELFQTNIGESGIKDVYCDILSELLRPKERGERLDFAGDRPKHVFFSWIAL